MSASKENPPTKPRAPTGTTQTGAAASAGDKPAWPDADPTGKPAAASKEHGGPAGPEPTRFGDWERNGRCVDF